MIDKHSNYETWLVKHCLETMYQCKESGIRISSMRELAAELNARSLSNARNEPFDGKTLQKFFSRLSKNPADIERRKNLAPDDQEISRMMKPTSYYQKLETEYPELFSTQRNTSWDADADLINDLEEHIAAGTVSSKIKV